MSNAQGWIAQIMATESRRRFWEIGIPLNEAWSQFAPASERQKLEAVKGFFGTLNPELEAASDPKSIFLPAALKALASMNEKRQIEDNLQELLLEELLNANLLAVGFRVRPTTSRGPVLIEAGHFYDANALWADGVVEAIGFRYERVRVLDPSTAAVQAIPRRKIGRPGSTEAIVRAIKRLALEPEFRTLPRKSACDQVRKEIRNSGFSFDPINPPKGSGLNDANITKLIVQICRTKSVNYEEE